MAKRQTDFLKSVKQTMASRVGWRCSFPGCRMITIGPSMDKTNKFIILGDAAHIYAASSNGPRANLTMTISDLSSIDNGIWLCKQHARMIDLDPGKYSAETLHDWKLTAEAETYRLMKELRRENVPNKETLIAITNKILFYGVWAAVNDKDDLWTFRVGQFLEGDANELQKLYISYTKLPDWEKFLAIESQGEGRPLPRFLFEIDKEGQLDVKCQVGPKADRRNPHSFGFDIAYDFESQDLKIENGGFTGVYGIDTAIQNLQVILSSPPGEFADGSSIGSHFSRYCWQYADNLSLLRSLIKIEIIRLMEVKYSRDSEGTEFDFINRILNLDILSLNLEQRQARISLELELGNLEHWMGEIVIPIR